MPKRSSQNLTRIFALVFSACVLAGCQSMPTAKSFERVEEGMSKAAVLEVAGNPTRTQRWQGKDRWVYGFRGAGNAPDVIREVHFQDGRVVYRGAQVIPEVSAEEQDQRNEESNRAAAKAQREEAEAAKARSQAYQLGTSGPEEARKVAPKFEPVR